MTPRGELDRAEIARASMRGALLDVFVGLVLFAIVLPRWEVLLAWQHAVFWSLLVPYVIWTLADQARGLWRWFRARDPNS